MPTRYSSPRSQCAINASRFDCVPLGTNSAASKPSSDATRACSAFTLGSSPITSSPTAARRPVSRMAGVGWVTVSLRRSTHCMCRVLPDQVIRRSVSSRRTKWW